MKDEIDGRFRDWKSDLVRPMSKGESRKAQVGLTQNERWSLNSKRYRLRHPERTRAQRKAQQRKYQLKHFFQLSIEEYQKMLRDQDGKCAICRKKQPQKALAVDHDHKTGRVRALLCDKCNRVVGLVNEDANISMSLTTYLQTHK